jgi:hypothetical protein
LSPNTIHNKNEQKPEAHGKPGVTDPYESGMVTTPFIILRPGIVCRVVAVITSVKEKRGLRLIHPQTRCFRKNEVHELLMTDEIEASPGGTVDRVAGIGFVEFAAGGVMIRGDKVIIGDRDIGEIVGFDETHMPNHYNIVLKGPKMITGEALGIKAGDEIFISGDEGGQ